MIYLVPLEPLHERYTEQWSRWWPNALSELGVDFVTISGTALTSKIETGNVLDVYGTHYWKFSQLQKLMSLLRDGTIKNGDTILFHDLWFPGIESLQYVRDMTGIDFKIAGILHAGTWDKADFTSKVGMTRWARGIEQAWLSIFDTIFVGSEFHKTLIEAASVVPLNIHVTGLPFLSSEVRRDLRKDKIVVFPHRLDSEKSPELFTQLSKDCAMDGWSFIRTKDVCSSKEDYFNLLGKSAIAISTAQQETFGYAMLEAKANGCICIVPNSLSYATMRIYNGQRYSDYDELVSRLRAAMVDEPSFIEDKLLNDYEPITVIKKMVDLL